VDEYISITKQQFDLTLPNATMSLEKSKPQLPNKMPDDLESHGTFCATSRREERSKLPRPMLIENDY